MAVSTIKYTDRIPQVLQIEQTYSIGGSGSWNANLKDLIDNNMPSGYKFGGLAGWALNETRASVVNCGYYPSAYSCQIVNRTTSSISNQSLRIYFIAIPI